MEDNQLLRYSRHIFLPEIDIDGQKKINSAKVLLIGLGALGSVVSQYLCRAGVNELCIYDFDKIDISNLHRQILFKTSDVGKSKITQAYDLLNGVNPDCTINLVEKAVDAGILKELLPQYDVVIDASDNFNTRYIVNQACYTNKKVLISGSAIQWSGQLVTFDFSNETSPCYECCFGYDEEEDLNCAEAGIMAPVTGIIGSMQALEVLKNLTEVISNEETILHDFNFLTGKTKKIRILKDPNCRICS